MMMRFAAIAAALLVQTAAAPPPLELFVAPAADTDAADADVGDGSRARPFRSLARARDAVRASRAEGFAGNATVHLQPGRYSAREGVPLSLTSEDSGSAESWTTFRAADATAPPVLSAGVAVPAQLFRPWARNPRVLVANVSGLVDDLGRFGASPAGACAHDHAELYFGGEPQTVARYPNKFAAGSAAFAGTPLRQWARTAAGATDLVVVAADAPSPAIENDWARQGTGWLHGYWDEDWADTHVPLAAVLRNGSLKMGCQPAAGKDSCQPVLKGARWYAQNLLSELDVESEYYIDAERKLLYFFPPHPIRPEDDGLAGGAFLSAGEHVITVENAAYIQFEGVAIVRTPPLTEGAHPF